MGREDWDFIQDKSGEFVSMQQCTKQPNSTWTPVPSSFHDAGGWAGQAPDEQQPAAEVFAHGYRRQCRQPAPPNHWSPDSCSPYLAAEKLGHWSPSSTLFCFQKYGIWVLFQLILKLHVIHNVL